VVAFLACGSDRTARSPDLLNLGFSLSDLSVFASRRVCGGGRFTWDASSLRRESAESNYG